MTPVDAARRLYDLYPQDSAFDSDLIRYVQNGYVWSSPKAFIMARPAWLYREEEWLTGETLAFADCWFVWCHVGPLSELFRVCPFPLPWVVFYRRGRRKVYDFQRLAESLTQKG